jgi:two-component system chemotaxis response regulator CheV
LSSQYQADRCNAEADGLFADDSAVARKQIQRTLEAMGVQYVAAINGREAWDELDKMAKFAQSIGSGSEAT